MRLLILDKENYVSFDLPFNVYGNYWITIPQKNNKIKNLINVEEENNLWKIRKNEHVNIIINKNYVDSITLTDYFLCYLEDIDTKEIYILYTEPSYDKTFMLLENTSDNITVGRNINSSVSYNSVYVKENQIKITKNNGNWLFENIDLTIPVYINKKRVSKCYLKNGDLIFVMGLKIIITGNYLIVNNPNNLCKTNILLKKYEILELNYDDTESEEEIPLYSENDYYFRSPRFRNIIEPENIKIDEPPSKPEENEMPMILTMGSMMTMGATSIMSCVTAINNLSNENRNLATAIPSLILAVIMLIGMLVFPLLSRKWTEKNNKKKEKIRQEKYSKYITKKRTDISNIIKKQRDIAIANNISLADCEIIIKNKQRNLWERRIEDDDFLSLSVGIGNEQAQINISMPEERFSLIEDNLLTELNKIQTDKKEMENVPISVSLTKKNISGILGNDELTNKCLDNLLIQAMTFHSYDNLKIVVLSNKKDYSKWEKYKNLPHMWNNEKNLRFFGTNDDENNTISIYLTEDFNQRKFGNDNDTLKIREMDYKNFAPYYLIIIDDYADVKNLSIINSILSSKINYGFSLVILEKRLNKLPNETNLFINIDINSSGLIEPELVKDTQKSFVPNLDFNIDIEALCTKLANVPIEFTKGKYGIPDVVTFLEMYDVGKVEQLNSLDRWKRNNSAITLQAPVGINENGELFNLDLHEKAHGPHGLIAGMTGSGKSEFIITYIMSMAVNFHPDDINFVLIDYKGGGLAGAFQNKETGVKLPHLAGTITNLDTAEINRALASIESELRRRQKLFNIAREKVGESTIDIYKYQKYYHEGMLNVPVPHLFIISDEFAELKMQQPDFMDKLISTARIGRSLGVHLILATQKPSGIVNDQIWSNSKFRICLKVQDKSDSMDMIKTSDAAKITEVGRFILQVGFNELYAIGQSAWCGASYYPQDIRKKKVDLSINYINNIGTITKSINKTKTAIVKSEGEELGNILKYLNVVANKEKINVHKLWLDRIPNIIFSDDLKEKYHYEAKMYDLNPIIGEYDNPKNQSQHLLTLPISKEGNTIVYGIVGSGKELVISTILYSLVTNHSSSHLNIYILDFGSESMRVWSNIPHVGDVILSSENDKIDNLFKYLTTLIIDRKQTLSLYGGTFNSYIAKEKNPMAEILVVINNYDAFNETYPDYMDTLLKLTREGIKCGIYFIITTNGTNIRYKLSQNFSNQIVLEQNDKSDYMGLLGRIGDLQPAKVVGRGLIKIDEDGIYEFQTAYIVKKEEFINYINELSIELNKTYVNKAFKIPILPDKITRKLMSKASKLNQIPIGIRKVDLGFEYLNLNNSDLNVISASKLETLNNFMIEILKSIDEANYKNITLIDSSRTFSKIPFINLKYIKNNVLEEINKLNENINEITEEYEKNEYDDMILTKNQKVNLLIYDLEDFVTKLGADYQKLLTNLILKNNKINMINFTIIDSPNHLKKFEYEEWFKLIANSSNGIWYGNGIVEQYAVKVSKITRELSNPIPETFGYVVKNGIPYYTKFIEADEDIIDVLE